MSTLNDAAEFDALKSVTLAGGLWGALLERNRSATLPHVMRECLEHGHVRNLDVAIGKSSAPYEGGADRDSNLHKVIEGAAYCLAQAHDAPLDATLDDWIARLAAVQTPDGYLQSYISSQTPDQRYADLHRSHELYCMGHLIEAAVEHWRATGKRSFLDVATRVGDHVDATFGFGKLEKTSGHQEIELALVKLYRATGEKRYLELSRYFVEMRGNPAMVRREYGGKPIDEGDRNPGRNRPPQYRQDHLPAVEQREAVGHAVRAGYLYAAMADLALECPAPALGNAARAIWDDIVTRKLYLTGGVGTHQYRDEGFGDPYRLPNDSAYCETCGGIALLLFSWRMSRLTRHAKYADLVELILYNNMLACTDLAGVNFFYRNPLESDGTRKRNPWCNPACCPTNIIRVVPQFARLMYARQGDSLYVDQFAGGTLDLVLDGATMRVTQETNYPWDGRVTLRLDPSEPREMALHLRVPGWSEGRPVASDLYTTHGDSDATPALLLNGRPVEPMRRENGYCVIRRTWKAGDRVTLDLPMPVRRVYAHAQVEACAGQVALMRGPLVYCVEQADFDADLQTLALHPSTQLVAQHMPGLLSGVTVIRGANGAFTAIPYYAWNNRSPGRMQVWMREAD